ncbi:MAG TPA: efflux RND transporter periplasmic adaptor subunit [Myxococcota bacterium]|nr:efflux RND transporter periplasmic adaptor subunit [Myxococcota bacterium]
MRNPGTLLLTLILAATVVVSVGCKDKAKSEKTAVSTDVAVLVQKVETADIATVLNYNADLMASSKVRLIALMTDTILSFPWREGDEIAKGQVVAVVKKEALSHGLAQLDAQAVALDVQIANLKSELERARDLLAKGVATQQAVDQLNAQYSATVAQKDALVAGRRQLAVSAGHAVVKAPVDGVLSGKMYEEGDIASPQMPLGTLLVTDPIKIELKLVEKDISRVSIGQDVDLKLDAWPDRKFTGTVARVFPYVDQATRTNTVEVMVPNPRGEDGARLLKPGMFGTASLVVERRQGVVTVPESALLIDNKLVARQQAGQLLRKAFVVDSEGLAREKVLVLGAREGDRWEIVDGLAAGESLVVRGQHGLKDGMKVKIVEDGKAPAAEAPATQAPAAEAPAANVDAGSDRPAQAASATTN